jgi:1,2-diacylglycerol 3-alpha-glucosyltransferase
MGLTGRYIARHLAIPHVHTMHTMWDEYRHYFAKYFVINRILSVERMDAIIKSFVSRCTALVCPSSKSQAYLKRLGINRSYIINNGVDAKLFGRLVSNEEKNALRSKLGFNSNDIVVIFVGRVAHEKRACELYNLIKEANKQNKHIKGLFIGQGPDLDGLRTQSKQDGLEDSFVFTGYLAHEEVFSYYVSSDIFCTLSLSEVQPMTVIESLIAALPLVARNDLAYLDMIKPNINGFLPGSDEEALQNILQLASNAPLRQKLGEQSVALSQCFTAARQASEMEKLYLKVLDWGRPDRRYGYLNNPN